MDQPANPIPHQVREILKTAVKPFRMPRPEAPAFSGSGSFEAEALKAEIILAGRKLWERQYVDGNAGNISCRLGENYVLCTPTMISKRDMEPADICLADLDGNIVAGHKPRTSELFLHLEIYRANPRARAVVHCHPPYATAFSLTGEIPPVGLISEYELFIGPAAVTQYETAGTRAFAESVLPFVQDHNTILLANHGVVCWSDTVTHAQWLTEILESYCKICVIAKQIGKPLRPIPEEKIQELLALKRQLGFPDSRMTPLAAANGSSVSATPAVDLEFRKAMQRMQNR
jgi:L-fuculose-phosphate aldolase